MPKYGTMYDDQISFICRKELRDKLTAFSYLRGEDGEYAAAARFLIDRGVDNAVRDMDIDERRRFDEILRGVREAINISRTNHQQRYKGLRRGRGGIRLPPHKRVDEDHPD